MEPNKLPTCECLRCGYKWHPRKTTRSGNCPKCNSRYWDTERTKGIYFKKEV